MNSLRDLLVRWHKQVENLDPEGPRMRLSDNRKDALVGANLNGQMTRLVLCIRELEEVIALAEGEPL